MKRPIIAGLGLALVGVLAAGGVAATTARSGDCPGTKICPLTGDLICVERCPVQHPDALACPGTIACPETGETICIDRCPLGVDTAAAPVRDCCQPQRVN